ncbi:MAG: hypothetical protein DRI71_01565 [Bacteroidetes bacterium]|nr:MAG: hypothetical protein DRI71_01565 [Bacteroidota bacterium]
MVKSWDDANKKRGGDFNFDMFRLYVDGNYNNVIVSTQIRLYSSDFGGILIHHAWMGYKFKNSDEIQLGINKVPFGITPYASHNWFFNMHYYFGFEDDYDLGIKYVRERDKLKLYAAYYRTSELPPHIFARYSYDVVDTHNEINQLNFKVLYDLSMVELGASIQLGQLEEVATGDKGDRYAFAIHAESNINNFNIMLQSIFYGFSPTGPITDRVIMAAYDAPYAVASEGVIYSIGIRYHLPLELGPLTGIDFYNDYAYLNKTNSSFYDSQMNVLGAGVTFGPIYTYIDWASGINHSWLGPDYDNSFAEGVADNKWHSRFNINFGYYF